MSIKQIHVCDECGGELTNICETCLEDEYGIKIQSNYFENWTECDICKCRTWCVEIDNISEV